MTENEEIIEKLYRAYLYGLPLLVLDVHVQSLTNTILPTATKAPVNQFIHAKNVAGAEDREIIHPNIDTVYSKAHIDLKQGPLWLHKPEADRYTSAEVLDAYGNAVAIVGSGGIGGNADTSVILTTPGDKTPLPEGLPVIRIHTRLCWILVRILKGENDEAEIQRLQHGFDLRPVSQIGKHYEYPPGKWRPERDFIPYDRLQQLDIETSLNRINELLVDNPGEDPDTGLLSDVKPYGVGPGEHFVLSALPAQVQEAVRGFFARAVEDFRINNQSGGNYSWRGQWRAAFQDSCLAHFGREYLFRAKTALWGFGALPDHIAIYPQTTIDDRGRPLDGSYSYLCHFDTLPPVEEFWSLTAYGADYFLIPNELNRNGFNDRSAYVLNQDGSLNLYISAAPPEREKVSNWLPVTEGRFGLVLRMYSPDDSVRSGEWKLPVVSRLEL